MKTVGLQTHIWSNNYKSFFLILMFPVIIGILLYSVIFAIVAAGGNIQSETQNSNCEYYSDNYCIIEEEVEISNTDILSDTNNLFMLALPYMLGGVITWFVIAWFFNKAMITDLTGAKEISRQNNPEIFNIVENLCISRGLRTPKIYLIEDDSMNAFAYGFNPSDSFIAFSRGILNQLNKDEIEAVAAHELTHIMNQDTRLMLIAIIFVGIIQTIAEIIIRTNINIKSDKKDSGAAFMIIIGVKVLAFILGFLFSIIIQSLISQKREYLADAGAVELTKTSEHLISALQKISSDSKIEAVNNHSVAQMFIFNPLSNGHQNFFYSLFATHPPMNQRIKALEMIG